MSPPVELFSPIKPSSTAKAVSDEDEQELLWKKELSNATTSAAELLARLNLNQHLKEIDNQPDFRCMVTDNYINKIKTGDINDPLLRQILPLTIENHAETQKNGKADPVGDLNAQVTQGLLHKYHGRALLVSTGACAIHCRYCFRRSYPYQQSSCTSKALSDTVTYLNAHNEIEEVILSGGDPLVLSNEKLSTLINKFSDIKHIQTLRIHTRIPVVLPSRITEGLLHLLQSSRLQIVIVIHANHANELQHHEHEKLHLLHQAGVTLLNQSVLLKGINDNVDALTALSKRLLQCKTIPYYLHLFDRVTGAMHFETSKQLAQQLLDELSAQLPGYLVPKLVQEIAGSQSKTAIFRI